jgi:hypothetical protein
MWTVSTSVKPVVVVVHGAYGVRCAVAVASPGEHGAERARRAGWGYDNAISKSKTQRYHYVVRLRLAA